MLQTTKNYGQQCETIIIRQRKELKPRTRKIVVPSTKNSPSSIRRENVRKFTEFMKGKAFEIVETKFSLFKLQPKTFKDFLLKQIIGNSFDYSFRRIAYIDGVYQQFNRQFQKELREIENLDLNKEFKKFLTPYFKELSQSGKKKVGRPKAYIDEITGKIKGALKKENRQVLEMVNAGEPVESIISSVYQGIRTPLGKAKMKRKIKRILRENKHLLTKIM